MTVTDLYPAQVETLSDWKVREIPPKTKMLGSYCELVPLIPELHASQLYSVFQLHPEDWKYLPYGPFYKYEEFYQWLSQTTSGIDPQFYVIFDSKTQQAVGVCSYLRIFPEHGSIEVGHLHFSNVLKRTPAATESMYLMMKRAFEECGYRRYEWKCNALNKASAAAALRLGFTYEGCFRQSHVFKNQSRDTLWFSIIDKEWPQIKKRFQKWLDPNNFDVAGEQIKKLSDF